MTRSRDLILILDFGSQYTQLIARRIRELGIFSLVQPYNISTSKIRELNPKGVVLSGGPNSVNFSKTLRPRKDIFNLKIPILGICYGMQLLAINQSGKVEKTQKREYGNSILSIKEDSKLFSGIPLYEITGLFNLPLLFNISVISKYPFKDRFLLSLID